MDCEYYNHCYGCPGYISCPNSTAWEEFPDEMHDLHWGDNEEE